MRYFIVFQGKTFNQEQKGGYLWAPKKSKDNEELFHWKNMTKVRSGDIIFSIANGKIFSVNEAKSDCVEKSKPTDENFNDWGDDGWYVKVDYNLMSHPIVAKEHFSEFRDMLPSRYAPFDKNGDGNQGYLFEIGSTLANYILDLIQKNNSDDFVGKIEAEVESSIIKDVNSLIDKTLDKTEAKIVVKSRVGQGLFKSKLFEIADRCAVCGLKTKELLIASHIKPWSESNNKERLDVNNGFLMCPTHDALFDKGYITFTDDGNILVSSAIPKTEYELLNIDEKIKINVRREQIKYIKWHRENIFKKNLISNEANELNDK